MHLHDFWPYVLETEDQSNHIIYKNSLEKVISSQNLFNVECFDKEDVMIKLKIDCDKQNVDEIKKKMKPLEYDHEEKYSIRDLTNEEEDIGYSNDKEYLENLSGGDEYKINGSEDEEGELHGSDNEEGKIDISDEDEGDLHGRDNEENTIEGSDKEKGDIDDSDGEKCELNGRGNEKDKIDGSDYEEGDDIHKILMKDLPNEEEYIDYSNHENNIPDLSGGEEYEKGFSEDEDCEIHQRIYKEGEIDGSDDEEDHIGDLNDEEADLHGNDENEEARICSSEDEKVELHGSIKEESKIHGSIDEEGKLHGREDEEDEECKLYQSVDKESEILDGSDDEESQIGGIKNEEGELHGNDENEKVQIDCSKDEEGDLHGFDNEEGWLDGNDCEEGELNGRDNEEDQLDYIDDEGGYLYGQDHDLHDITPILKEKTKPPQYDYDGKDFIKNVKYEGKDIGYSNQKEFLEDLSGGEEYEIDGIDDGQGELHESENGKFEMDGSNYEKGKKDESDDEKSRRYLTEEKASWLGNSEDEELKKDLADEVNSSHSESEVYSFNSCEDKPKEIDSPHNDEDSRSKKYKSSLSKKPIEKVEENIEKSKNGGPKTNDKKCDNVVLNLFDYNLESPEEEVLLKNVSKNDEDVSEYNYEDTWQPKYNFEVYAEQSKYMKNSTSHETDSKDFGIGGINSGQGNLLAMGDQKQSRNREGFLGIVTRRRLIFENKDHKEFSSVAADPFDETIEILTNAEKREKAIKEEVSGNLTVKSAIQTRITPYGEGLVASRISVFES